MGAHTQRGFTIIETMLVLAITGVLVAGVFVGIGTSINVQRYRDSVQTLKNLLQTQYAEITSVLNDRNDQWSCDAQATTSDSGSVDRGQTDCVLLGRLVTINQSDITVYSVLGRQVGSAATTNDITSLTTNYVLNVSSVEVVSDSLEWGAAIAWPASGAGGRSPTMPRQISILYLRSPDSGQVYTFTSDQAPDAPTPQDLRSMVVAGQLVPGQAQRTICINSNDVLVTDDYSIIIASFASVPSAIETSTNNLLQQQGVTTRC
jgi:prepilin-type N-terminal cleavage/methylation domain-containing protein